MLKQVPGWEIGKEVKHRVVVKSFSGAKTNDMRHYLIPTIEKEPQQIILHIGTNDLKNEEPSKITDNIVDLARKIETESNATVVISELIARSDMSESIKSVNKKLKQFCNQNGWPLIEHKNITTKDLNMSGLHLNKAGNNILSNNFIHFLKSFHPWSSDIHLSGETNTSSQGHQSVSLSNNPSLNIPLPSLNLPITKGFKIVAINIGSLYKHIDQLRIYMSNKPVDILAINETRLDHTISDKYSWVCHREKGSKQVWWRYCTFHQWNNKL